MTNLSPSCRYEQRRIRLPETDWEVVDRFSEKLDLTISQVLSEMIAHWANLHL